MNSKNAPSAPQMPAVLRSKWNQALTSDIDCAMETYLRAIGISAAEVKDQGITMTDLLPSLKHSFKRWRDVTATHLKRLDHTFVNRYNSYVAEISINIPKLEGMIQEDSSLSDAQPDEPTDQSRNDEPPSIDEHD